MKTMNHPYHWRLALALALTGGTGACDADPQSAASRETVVSPLLQLGECEEKGAWVQFTAAQCGVLKVFEDRDAGRGRTLDLHVMVLQASGKHRVDDPLFILAGGPGQSAIEVGPMMLSSLKGILKQRDIVLLDQRGTGKSNALDCKDPDRGSLAAQFRVKPKEGAFAACLRSYDADPTLYTTPLAMDDLNEVREALGYHSINLLGVSYGTRAALVYMRRHPETVRSVILDGVAPVGIKLPLFTGEDGTRALERIFTDCEQQPSCARRFPKLREHYQALMARLKENPETQQLLHPRTGEKETITIQAEAIAGMVFSALYMSELSSILPLAIEAAYAHDYQPLVAIAMAVMGEGEGLSAGMHFSVTCAEDVSQISDQDMAALRPSLLETESSLARAKERCEQWPTAILPKDFFKDVRSSIPTFLLSGELDPVTPPRWGEEVASHLENSLHLVVPGIGHGAWSHACVPELLEEFIDHGDAKAMDTHCVDSIRRPDFFVSNAGPIEKKPVTETGAQEVKHD